MVLGASGFLGYPALQYFYKNRKERVKAGFPKLSETQLMSYDFLEFTFADRDEVDRIGEPVDWDLNDFKQMAKDLEVIFLIMIEL
jgi:hypothetical protein